MRRRLKAAHYKNLQRLSSLHSSQNLCSDKSQNLSCGVLNYAASLFGTRFCKVPEIWKFFSWARPAPSRKCGSGEAWDSSAFSAFSSPWGGCIECHLNLIGSSWKYIILIFCHIAAVWHFAGSVTKLQTQTFPLVFIPLLLHGSVPVVVFLTRQTHTFAKFVCPWHSYHWYIQYSCDLPFQLTSLTCLMFLPSPGADLTVIALLAFLSNCSSTARQSSDLFSIFCLFFTSFLRFSGLQGHLKLLHLLCDAVDDCYS